MKQCEQCGFQNPPQALFCGSCGGKLLVQQIPVQKDKTPKLETAKPKKQSFLILVIAVLNLFAVVFIAFLISTYLLKPTRLPFLSKIKAQRYTSQQAPNVSPIKENSSRRIPKNLVVNSQPRVVNELTQTFKDYCRAINNKDDQKVKELLSENSRKEFTGTGEGYSEIVISSIQVQDIKWSNMEAFVRFAYVFRFGNGDVETAYYPVLFIKSRGLWKIEEIEKFLTKRMEYGEDFRIETFDPSSGEIDVAFTSGDDPYLLELYYNYLIYIYTFFMCFNNVCEDALRYLFTIKGVSQVRITYIDDQTFLDRNDDQANKLINLNPENPRIAMIFVKREDLEGMEEMYNHNLQLFTRATRLYLYPRLMRNFKNNTESDSSISYQLMGLPTAHEVYGDNRAAVRLLFDRFETQGKIDPGFEWMRPMYEAHINQQD